MNFKGKVVLVTGASRGIGEYIAYEFASLGADVALVAKSSNDQPHRVFAGTVEATAEKVESYGVKALAVRGDVSLAADVQTMYDKTMERFGRCDILINNAAGSYVGPFLELSVKRWEILLKVNVLGPVMLAKAFLPQMMERGDGRIVNISSGAGRLQQDPSAMATNIAGGTETLRMGEASFGDAGQGLGDSLLAYGTSKAALNRFTIGLAQEMRGQGIGVNALGGGAATPAYRYTLPNADYSANELEEAPAQVTCWLASQPPEVTGHIFEQGEVIGDLRARGIVRPKVDPI